MLEVSSSVATWAARERGFLMFFGTQEIPADWRSRLTGDERGLPAVELEEPHPGYATFGALDRILEKILPIARREAPSLVDEYAPALGLFTDPAERNALGRLVPLAESARLGTTRRISRESHDSAKIIDKVARFLALLPGRTSAYADGLILLVPGIEAWDRPSLRVLYRAALLSVPEAPLVVVGLCAPDLTPQRERPATVQERMTALRCRFLAGLAERHGVHAVHLGQDASRTFPHEPVDVGDPDDADTLLRSIGEALSFQNFERVLLIAEGARDVVEGDLAVQVRRLSAIADAQSGDLETARAQLTAARKSSGDPVVVAHLHYLIGLLLTKRVYDLDAAMREYDMGQEVIADLVENNPQARIEYAWLLNGQALIAAMKARSVDDGSAREKLFEDAFNRAFEAFRLVSRAGGLSAFYLRHNLSANITFLLEITSRVAEARSFWERVMAAPSERESRDFILPYRLRAGLLLHKEGHADEALAAIEESLVVARDIGDPFYEERVLASLGYVAATTGRLARAEEAFRNGMAVAARLRDIQAQQVHAAGLLWVAARREPDFDGEWIHHVHAWPPQARERLAAAFADGTLDEAVTELGLRPQVPGPKLPPYIPGVDLEGAPQKDLNRLLVGADADHEPAKRRVKEREHA